MKKIFAFLIALCICLTSLLNVMAVDIESDGANGAITVSGSISGATRGNTMLILKFIDGGENGELDDSDTEIFMDYTRTVRSGDTVTYAFDKLFLPEDLPNGKYFIKITGEDLNEPICEPYSYSNPSAVLAALGRLSVAAANTSSDADNILLNSFKAEASSLGISLNDFNSLATDVGKAAFANILRSDVDYGEMPDATEAREKIAEYNFKVIEDIKLAHSDGIAVGTFVEIDSQTAFNEWYNVFYEALGFVDGTGTKSVTPWLKKVMNSEDLTTRIIDATGKMTIADIKTYIYESALLAAIYQLTDSETEEVLMNFSTYFDGIDKTSYDKLSDLKKGKVIAAVRGKHFDTCDEAEIAVNEAIESVNATNESSGSNGGGAGSGGGTNRSDAIYVPVNEETTVDGFFDLNDKHWAYNAVKHLREKNIVSGHPDGSFAPDDNVTRAEFIKMVCLAIGLEPDENGTASFADVDDDEWYAPYISTAKSKGIVTGDETGMFNPQWHITREDMVTILYRALGNPAATAESTVFADNGDISGYARDGVTYFSSKRIVSGVGNNRFAPKENATRAETAMLIYNVLNV